MKYTIFSECMNVQFMDVSVQVRKQEVDNVCKSSALRVLNQGHLEMPGITVMISSADKWLSYILTAKPPHKVILNVLNCIRL